MSNDLQDRDLTDAVRNAFGRVFARDPGPTAAMRAYPSVWLDGNDELVCVTMSVREAQGFVEVMANDHGVLRDAGIVEPWRKQSRASTPPGGLSEEERVGLRALADLAAAANCAEYNKAATVINRLLNAAPPPASSPAPVVPHILADARQDTVHVGEGPSRPARSVKAAPVAPLTVDATIDERAAVVAHIALIEADWAKAGDHAKAHAARYLRDRIERGDHIAAPSTETGAGEGGA
jgi:hypothetical protein